MLDRPSNLPFRWTDEAIATLTRLWGEGLSARQVAAQMGLSRNAIIGKVSRLKLKRATNGMQTSAIATKAHHARVSRREYPAFETSPLPEEELGNDVTPLIGSVLGLNEHTCKWPIGDPLLPGFGFCGRHSMETSPYCEEHYKRGTWKP